VCCNDQTVEEQKKTRGNSPAAEEQKGVSGSCKGLQVPVICFLVDKQNDYGQELARLTCSDPGGDN